MPPSFALLITALAGQVPASDAEELPGFGIVLFEGKVQNRVALGAGVFVRFVDPGSGNGKRVRTGDELLRVAGTEVKDTDQATVALRAAAREGTGCVELEIARAGKVEKACVDRRVYKWGTMKKLYDRSMSVAPAV